MSEKVYCKGCKYCVDGGKGYAKCAHPKNVEVTKTIINFAYDSNLVKIYKKKPYCGLSANVNNNCVLREQKPWWMFWVG